MKKNVCIKLSYVLQLIIIVFISNFIAACSDKKQSKCSEQVNGHIEYKLNNGSKEIMRTESQIEDIGDNDKEKKDLLLYLLEIQKANLEDTIQEMRSCNS